MTDSGKASKKAINWLIRAACNFRFQTVRITASANASPPISIFLRDSRQYLCRFAAYT
jgi:hypothetical protein